MDDANINARYRKFDTKKVKMAVLSVLVGLIFMVLSRTHNDPIDVLFGGTEPLKDIHFRLTSTIKRYDIRELMSGSMRIERFQFGPQQLPHNNHDVLFISLWLYIPELIKNGRILSIDQDSLQISHNGNASYGSQNDQSFHDGIFTINYNVFDIKANENKRKALVAHKPVGTTEDWSQLMTLFMPGLIQVSFNGVKIAEQRHDTRSETLRIREPNSIMELIGPKLTVANVRVSDKFIVTKEYGMYHSRCKKIAFA